MTTFEQLAIRRALAAVPKADLPDLVLTVVGRVGGQGALMAAIAEAANTRADRLARRRHSTAAQREVRA